MHTHTLRKLNVGYECRGKLFGHDAPRHGKVHALGGQKDYPHVGTVLLTACGEKVNAGRADLQPVASGVKVTCRRCQKMLKEAAHVA